MLNISPHLKSEVPVDEVANIVDGLFLVGAIDFLDVQVVVDLFHCRDVVFIAAAVCALQEFVNN
jgi:hypothetical protein